MWRPPRTCAKQETPTNSHAPVVPLLTVWDPAPIAGESQNWAWPRAMAGKQIGTFLVLDPAGGCCYTHCKCNYGQL
jgi:hypothetical protein